MEEKYYLIILIHTTSCLVIIEHIVRCFLAFKDDEVYYCAANHTLSL